MAKIEKHLPGRFADIEEFMSLCKAENPEFDNLEEIRKKWLNNKFPTEADLDGIKLYEKILDLKPNSDDSLEDRRFRVLSKLNERLPYTWIQLHRMMAALCGWDGYELKLEHFILTVYLAMDSRSKVYSVIDMLREVLPMHILMDIEQAVELYLDIAINSYSSNMVDVEIVPYQLRKADFDLNANVQSFSKQDLIVTIAPYQKRENDFYSSPSVVSGIEGCLYVTILPRVVS